MAPNSTDQFFINEIGSLREEIESLRAQLEALQKRTDDFLADASFDEISGYIESLKAHVEENKEIINHLRTELKEKYKEIKSLKEQHELARKQWMDEAAVVGKKYSDLVTKIESVMKTCNDGIAYETAQMPYNGMAAQFARGSKSTYEFILGLLSTTPK